LIELKIITLRGKMEKKPNILFMMTDQQRFDTIRALGNKIIYTPNLDFLVHRGLSFTNAYSTCPVCIPSRYTIRTGCGPPTTRSFFNARSIPAKGQAKTMEQRCGVYIAKRMKQLGYRTFGIGKFHSIPWDEDLGYEIQMHSEELYATPEQRKRDAYASFLHREHPEYDHLEMLMGERTEMYYMPQMSAQPAECTVEGWAAQQAVEQIGIDDGRPFFGFISFIGPHPPFAPPIPFNRMYNPDKMSNPICGKIEIDHMDQLIPMEKDLIWAEDINNPHARVLKARYYGEISYIDWCIGKILGAVNSRKDAGNTLICFFSDHGDHLGDHHAWQKESFFEASCRIPFLLSWPNRIQKNKRRHELICLTDLFGIATHAAGETEIREGVDVLGIIEKSANPREFLIGYYGLPGTFQFKIMVRDTKWKYIFLANGGMEQVFDLENDPDELNNLAIEEKHIARRMREIALKSCQHPGVRDALKGKDFRIFPFKKWVWHGERVYQFDLSRGIKKFPEKPEDALNDWLKDKHQGRFIDQKIQKHKGTG